MSDSTNPERSGPIADLWFRPDAEYIAITDDYAVIGYSANDVKAELAKFDLGYSGWVIKTFHDYAVHGDRWFTEFLTDEGILIYSDVDGKNSNHKQTVQDAKIKSPPLEEVEKGTEDAARMLVRSLEASGIFDNLHLRKDSIDAINKQKDSLAISSVRRLADNMTRGTVFVFIDWVIMLEESRQKVETLRILSKQADQELPRPVMLLIGLLRDIRTSDKTSKCGWAIGYDFIENVIQIKSFKAKEGENPLEEAWLKECPEDGFHQVRKLEDLAANLTSVVGAQLSGEDKSYALALAYVVGAWLQRHEKSLDFSEELSKSLQGQMDALMEDLKKIDFPDLPELKSTKLNFVQEEVESLRYSLQLNEDNLRQVALRSKKDGFEVSANNLAKYFEKALKDLDQIAKDPETPWEA